MAPSATQASNVHNVIILGTRKLRARSKERSDQLE